jgi:hypothetical protein
VRSLCLGSILVLSVGLAPAVARADDRAIAQQAFQEARALMAAGRVAEACPKFAAAAQLSQTAGVRLNLADCYAKLGKTASAWAKASEALSLADRVGDTAAASLARDQMSALQPKLSYLTLVVDRDGAPAGLEITLDGEKIPAPVWGTALPVDPGEHEIGATAPGRQPSSTKATITAEGSRVSADVVLPAVQGAPVAPPPATGAAEAGGQASAGGSSWSTGRTLALVSGGLGIVGVGIGTGFGLDASSKKSAYQQHQADGRCTDAECATLSQQALTSATASTIAFAAGGALLAAGAVLWLTAPGQSAEGRGVAIVPIVGPRASGAALSGSF